MCVADAGEAVTVVADESMRIALPYSEDATTGVGAAAGEAVASEAVTGDEEDGEEV